MFHLITTDHEHQTRHELYKLFLIIINNQYLYPSENYYDCVHDVLRVTVLVISFRELLHAW